MLSEAERMVVIDRMGNGKPTRIDRTDETLESIVVDYLTSFEEVGNKHQRVDKPDWFIAVTIHTGNQIDENDDLIEALGHMLEITHDHSLKDISDMYINGRAMSAANVLVDVKFKNKNQRTIVQSAYKRSEIYGVSLNTLTKMLLDIYYSRMIEH